MAYRGRAAALDTGGTLRCVLWHQGEWDARDDVATAQATYNAWLDTVGDGDPGGAELGMKYGFGVVPG
jgi:phage gp37-like protein